MMISIQIFEAVFVLFGLFEGFYCHGHGSRFDRPPVLIISFDGFRYDYVYRLRNLTSAASVVNPFESVIKSGVWAKKGLTNVFSTVTFPNHYSIVTGLYQETHGVVGNSVYLPQRQETYSLPRLKNEEIAKEIYGGEPIWVTYARQESEFRVGCFMWVGCTIPIKDLRLPAVVPYRKSSCEERLDWTLRWLEGGMELVLLYFDEPDGTGHGFGPDSKEVDLKLLELNECLGKLIMAMQNRKLENHVNMILVSDHGMIKFRKTVVISPNPELYKIRVGHYSHFLIEPLPGKEEESVSALKQIGKDVKVYRKSEIPEHWHYKNSDRITEILVVGEVGVKLVKQNDSFSKSVGGHGYDNSAPEMRPFFMARGPAFARDTQAPEEIHSVDLYLLMCRLLGIVPAPNNGSVRVVDALLRNGMPQMIHESSNHADEYFGMVTTSILVTVVTSTCVVLFVLVFVMFYRVSSKKGRQYCSVQTVNMRQNGFSYKAVPSDGTGLLAGVDSDSEGEEVFQST